MRIELLRFVNQGRFSEDAQKVSVALGSAALSLVQAVEMELAVFERGARRSGWSMRAGAVSLATAIIASADDQTGIGPVAMRCPRVRDRGGAGEAGKIRFTSAILPPYLRRAKSIEELIALDLAEGHLDGRLHRGPGRSSGAGRARVLGLDDHALEGCLARRAGALG